MLYKMSNKTNEPDKSKWLNVIKKHYVKLSIVSYLSAYIVFGVLISEYFCDKTYFSDNALLPGYVNREFSSKQQIQSNLKELRLSLGASDLDKVSDYLSASSRMPIDLLVSKFKNFGLEVYTQKFQFNYQFSARGNKSGTNIYAVFKGTRSLGTETLVLASPFRLNSKHSKSTLPGISLLISLAGYFSQKNYWSKDLIFLIYEHDLIGCEAWLNAYFDLTGDQSSLINFEQLENRNGIIRAAINLDITSELTPSLDIRIEGLNGQLTNLDLFNVVVEIASRESVDATFHERSHLFSPDHLEIWLEYAKTIGILLFRFFLFVCFYSLLAAQLKFVLLHLVQGSMMRTQASTFTNGAHGLFQKRCIESLTLATEEEQENEDYLKADLQQIGKIVEGVFRSCNNMIERFNRSYWFYLLPSTRRYLSIGFYMIPLALMVLPALLKALVIYLNVIEKHSIVIETFWTVLLQVIWAHLYGIVIASFPFIIQNSSKILSHFEFKSEELLFYPLLSFMCSLMFSPILNEQSIETDERSVEKESKKFPSDKLNEAELKGSQLKPQASKLKAISIRNYVALLNLALLLVCLSLVNVSLALILSAIYIPVMCTISSSPPTTLSKFRIFLQRLLLLLTNPLMLIYLIELTSSIYTEFNKSVWFHLSNSFIAQKHDLLSLVEDWYLFGNWTFLVGSVALFPLWLQFWYLSNCF